jgi:DNA-directed RNA polymerase subunit N (RpoN/RPB10)
LDETLRQLLDQQDWEDIVGKLTLAALNQLKLCGWVQDKEALRVNPAAKDGLGYAVDAMVKAYEACETGQNKWDPSRGKLYPFLERLVRRLVTDDKEKYTGGPSFHSLDDQLVEPRVEQRMGEVLIDLLERTDGELQHFIYAVIEQTESDGAGVHWGEIQETLGITRYRCDRLRIELRDLIETCTNMPIHQA